MNSLVNCPACGFRGQLPNALPATASIVCPQCKTAVAVAQLRQGAVPADGASLPIWVDGAPVERAPGDHAPVERAPVPPPVPESYDSDYMKEEAGRFTQYVTARLGELHKKRFQLTEAENRFESMTMGQKQEIHRA